MKENIKKVIPRFCIRIYHLFLNRMIEDLFNKNHDKRVLISYITAPFRKQSLAHTNYYEVTTAARVFDELGYLVDIIHYEGAIPDLGKYDVIYGFGDVFQEYFESGYHNKKTIYYGAGMHVCHQNSISLKRVKDVYRKKGEWLAKSARFVEKTWTHQTMLVDGIIALGNEQCAETYRKHYDGKIYGLPAPYFQTVDPDKVLASRHKSANRKYLWFGSSGLIHKGLDLCLEFFKTRPDLTLHICGNIYSETQFVKAYNQELFELPNIIVHGFVDVGSEMFAEILGTCSFVIFPSCSEGGSPSVLTAIGNGALIPIITKESSVSTGNEIWIEDFTVAAISKSVEYSQLLSQEKILELQLLNLNHVKKINSTSKYYENLKVIIKELLNR